MRTSLHVPRIAQLATILAFVWIGSAWPITIVHAQEAVAEVADRTTSDEAIATVLDDEGRLVVFARDIVPILRKNCLDCHGPDDAKNDFRVDDRSLMMDYVEPEDLESSSLYVDYLTIDDEDMLMPPRSHGGPLSPGELSLIRTWIEEGATWPDDVKFASTDGEVLAPVTTAAPKGLAERVWAAQGFLHPATVHFPIALLLFGAAFVVLGWKWPALGTQIPLACLLIGSLTAVVATLMGWSFAVEQGYGSWDRFDAEMMDREVFWHRWSGVILSVLSIAFAAIALLTLRGDRPKLTIVWKVGLLVCAGIAGAVGHQGGEMSYGKDFYPKALRTLLGTSEADTMADPVETPKIEPLDHPIEKSN
ncbi:Planctomycete cytochrome C [Rubripirellula tenax]|uniref:Planctomycete cytochrome C n=1 Tax=Rubripirellula tenax TaxID=2528015 RepID=A0A5C6FF65_9BACT|nr:c-type cytochrome domain-containing protein [Rubripirellula tenax]TWU59377.1 Planctomycete cytochrome C [Rubripirellula tenax]